jgi:hypothetical protein
MRAPAVRCTWRVLLSASWCSSFTSSSPERLGVLGRGSAHHWTAMVATRLLRSSPDQSLGRRRGLRQILVASWKPRDTKRLAHESGLAKSHWVRISRPSKTGGTACSSCCQTLQSYGRLLTAETTTTSLSRLSISSPPSQASSHSTRKMQAFYKHASPGFTPSHWRCYPSLPAQRPTRTPTRSRRMHLHLHFFLPARLSTASHSWHCIFRRNRTSPYPFRHASSSAAFIRFIDFHRIAYHGATEHHHTHFALLFSSAASNRTVLFIALRFSETQNGHACINAQIPHFAFMLFFSRCFLLHCLYVPFLVVPLRVHGLFSFAFWLSCAAFCCIVFISLFGCTLESA